MSADEMTTAPGSMSELAPGMEVRGRVKRIELYGAFVDIGVGQDALLHISQLGKPNVRNVEDVVKAGEEITGYILRVDREQNRIALSLEKPPAMTWDDLQEGKTVTGKVSRIEPYGVFVDIGAERAGMIHVSELASGYVSSPSEVVKVGEEVTARVIGLNRKKRRIDLSLKALEEPVQMPQDETENEHVPTAMELALRRAMEGREDDSPRGRQEQQPARKQDKRRELDEILQRTLRNHSR